MKVAGVSKDPVSSHAKFRAKLGLTFPLLSDPDHAVMEAYGAWGEKKMYGRPVQGTLRSTVIVEPDGRVQSVHENVKAAGHAQKVLEGLEGTGA